MVGRTWIEKAELAVSPPSTPVIGRVGEISETMQAKIAPSVSFRRQALDIMEEIEKALPAGARGVFGNNEEKRNEILDEMIREGCETVLAH